MNYDYTGERVRRYEDLDLASIRDTAKLDFARHTYGRGQCSCCYGPLDMLGAKWWRKGCRPKRSPDKVADDGSVLSYKYEGNLDNISYILFKNADNGSGRIKYLDEPIRHKTFIEYGGLSDEQMNIVCSMLQEQLGSAYKVIKPESNLSCIRIEIVNDEVKNEAEQIFRDINRSHKDRVRYHLF